MKEARAFWKTLSRAEKAYVVRSTVSMAAVTFGMMALVLITF